MKKAIGMVLLGLGGLAAAIALTVGALALAGDDVGSVVQPTLDSSSSGGSSGETRSQSPSVDDHGDDGTTTASPSADDHGGGGSGSDDPSGSDDHSGSGSNSGSGSSNSGSGSGDD